MKLVKLFDDYLDMAAAAQNMTREEYTAYYLSEGKTNEIKFNGKKVDISSIEIEGIDSNDYPDFVDSYASYAEYTNGKELTDSELDDFSDQFPDFVQQLAMETFQ